MQKVLLNTLPIVKILAFLVVFLSVPGCNLASEPIPVSDARQKSEGEIVKISGIVTSNKDVAPMRFLQDNGAGITLYDEQTGQLQKGDSIVVEGQLQTYNGLLQISDFTSLEVVNHNTTLPAPKKISPNDLQEIASFEGQLVQIDGWKLLRHGHFVSDNHEIVKEQDTFHIRTPPGHPFIGTPIPEDYLSVTGVVSRYYDFFRIIPLSDNGIRHEKGPGIKTSPIQTKIGEGSAAFKASSHEPATSLIQYGKEQPLSKQQTVADEPDTLHQTEISGLQPGEFYFARMLFIDEKQDTSFSRLKTFTSSSPSSGDIRVFFNRPVYETGKNLSTPEIVDTTMADSVVRQIKSAKKTIDAALYNLNNNGLTANISNALNEAHQNGIRVRIVACESTAGIGLDDLHEEIPVIRRPNGDERGIMHHKFFVFDANSSDPDEPYLLTGSMNFTENQVKQDPNNVVLIQDQTLAKAYQTEFETMWGSSSSSPDFKNSAFGQEKQQRIPRLFKIDGKKIELFFGPAAGATKNLTEKVRNTRHSVWAGTMLITKDEIAEVFIDAYINDKTTNLLISENPSADRIYSHLYDKIGENVLRHSSPGYFHHKYMIRDPLAETGLVWTGSQNWSVNGESYNDENVIVIHDQGVATTFWEEWLKRFQEAGGNPEKIITSIREENNPSEQHQYNENALLNDINTTNRIFIKNTANIDYNEKVNITIKDSRGVMVWDGQVSIDSGNSKMSFKVPKSMAPSGLYFISLQGSSFNISDWVFLE